MKRSASSSALSTSLTCSVSDGGLGISFKNKFTTADTEWLREHSNARLSIPPAVAGGSRNLVRPSACDPPATAGGIDRIEVALLWVRSRNERPDEPGVDEVYVWLREKS